MKISEIESIIKGSKFKYGFFSHVEFVGTDKNHVVLKDSEGNQMLVYKSLFAKHATPSINQ